MDKKSKSLLIVASIILEVYAFAWIVATIISALPYLFNLTAAGLLTAIQSFFDSLEASLGINALIIVGVVMLLPAVLLQVFSSLMISSNKRSRSGYNTIAVFAMVVVAVCACVSSIIAYTFVSSIWSIVVVAAPAIVIVAVFVAFVIVNNRQRNIAQQDIVVEPEQEQSVSMAPQSVDIVDEQSIVIEEDEQDTATPIPAPPVNQPQPPVNKVTSQYQPQELESIREIVNNTYGSIDVLANVSDEVRRQLNRLQKLYEAGAINSYEYQQLTLRFLSEGKHQ